MVTDPMPGNRAFRSGFSGRHLAASRGASESRPGARSPRITRGWRGSGTCSRRGDARAPQVLAALSEPVLHHREPNFRIVYEGVLGRLQRGASHDCGGAARGPAPSSLRSSISVRPAIACLPSLRRKNRPPGSGLRRASNAEARSGIDLRTRRSWWRRRRFWCPTQVAMKFRTASVRRFGSRSVMRARVFENSTLRTQRRSRLVVTRWRVAAAARVRPPRRQPHVVQSAGELFDDRAIGRCSSVRHSCASQLDVRPACAQTLRLYGAKLLDRGPEDQASHRR